MPTQTDQKMLDEHVQHIVEIVETGDYDDACFGECCGWDYLSSVLDYEWLFYDDKMLRGARILVSFGGPNIWINTATAQVEAYWGSSSVVRHYRNDALGLADKVAKLYAIAEPNTY